MRTSAAERNPAMVRESSHSTLSRRHQDALLAARLYYLQDLTMDGIARQLRTSRSTVSRLLAFARDEGLVQIQIHSPVDSAVALETAIAGRFGAGPLHSSHVCLRCRFIGWRNDLRQLRGPCRSGGAYAARRRTVRRQPRTRHGDLHLIMT